MRIAYKYHRVDKTLPFRESLDRTAGDFAESHTVSQLIQETKSAQDFERLFLANKWRYDFRQRLGCLLSPERETLSIGSGFGEIELAFILQGYRITCSDIVVDALAHTRKLYPSFRYIELDILDGSVAGSYDDLLITGLDYALDDAQTRKLFSVCARILRHSSTSDRKRLIFTLRYNDNLATRWIDSVVMPAEARLANLAYAIRGSNYRLRKKASGFRRSRQEIVALAAAFGFSTSRVVHGGFGVELTRSVLCAKARGLVEAVAAADRFLHLFNNLTIYEFVLREPTDRS